MVAENDFFREENAFKMNEYYATIAILGHKPQNCIMFI